MNYSGNEALELERYIIKIEMKMELERQRLQLEQEKVRGEKEVEIKKLEATASGNTYRTCGGIENRQEDSQ